MGTSGCDATARSDLSTTATWWLCPVSWDAGAVPSTFWMPFGANSRGAGAGSTGDEQFSAAFTWLLWIWKQYIYVRYYTYLTGNTPKPNVYVYVVVLVSTWTRRRVMEGPVLGFTVTACMKLG